MGETRQRGSSMVELQRGLLLIGAIAGRVHRARTAVELEALFDGRGSFNGA